MAPFGGADISLGEPSSASFRSANKRQEKLRDRNGNYDIIQCGPSMTSWVAPHPSSQKGVDRLKRVWIDSNLRVWIDSIKGCGSTQDIIDSPHCIYFFFSWPKIFFPLIFEIKFLIYVLKNDYPELHVGVYYIYIAQKLRIWENFVNQGSKNKGEKSKILQSCFWPIFGLLSPQFGLKFGPKLGPNNWIKIWIP